MRSLGLLASTIADYHERDPCPRQHLTSRNTVFPRCPITLTSRFVEIHAALVAFLPPRLPNAKYSVYFIPLFSKYFEYKLNEADRSLCVFWSFLFSPPRIRTYPTRRDVAGRWYLNDATSQKHVSSMEQRRGQPIAVQRAVVCVWCCLSGHRRLMA